LRSGTLVALRSTEQHPRRACATSFACVRASSCSIVPASDCTTVTRASAQPSLPPPGPWRPGLRRWGRPSGSWARVSGQALCRSRHFDPGRLRAARSDLEGPVAQVRRGDLIAVGW